MPKKITIKVYTIDELSDEAKRKAIDIYLSDYKYPYYNDADESLRAFLEYWGATYESWGVYSKPRLIYVPDLNRREIILKLDKLRFSPELTGYCTDTPLVEGFKEAFANMNDDLETLLDTAILKWWDEVVSDYEYLRSDESVVDILLNNEYLFTEDGNHFEE